MHCAKARKIQCACAVLISATSDSGAIHDVHALDLDLGMRHIAYRVSKIIYQESPNKDES